MKNFCIVFLLLTAENSNPNCTWHHRDGLFRLQNAANRSNERPKALANAAKFAAARFGTPGLAAPI
jgi:hypothetical protein